jgi:uncharacterized repeat protein (TIGR02543 family)
MLKRLIPATAFALVGLLAMPAQESLAKFSLASVINNIPSSVINAIPTSVINELEKLAEQASQSTEIRDLATKVEGLISDAVTSPVIRDISSQLGKWTVQTGSSPRPYAAIASSSDGTVLVKVEFPGDIYTSRDSGKTWNAQTTVDRFWTSVTTSLDGRLQAAVAANGNIFTSSDFGDNWISQTTVNRFWSSITSSADGRYLAAAESYGKIFTSDDFGQTWISRTSASQIWSSITSSADGKRLAAAVTGGRIWTTDDFGVTWGDSESPARAWVSVTSNDYGNIMAAVEANGKIYTSSDSGVTWTERTSVNRIWKSIVANADGSVLAAVEGVKGEIWTSIDEGLTWIAQEGAGERAWTAIAMSGLGDTLAAVGNGVRVWSGEIPVPTNYTVSFNSKGGSPIGAGSFVSGGTIDYSTSSTQFFDDALPEDSMTVPLDFQSHLGNEVLASESGWVEQVRYYRFSGDDSAISASVWSSDGVLLGSQLFAGGSESGWQSVTLAEPVYISANETFYVSVLTPSTPYAAGLTIELPNAGPWSLIGFALSGPADSFVPIEGVEGAFTLVDLVFETASVPTPTRAGYTFLGWSATDGGSVISLPYSPGVNQDITLYAKWSANSFTVTFNSNQGTPVSAGSFVTDATVTAPSNPTRTGYTFLGWSDTDGGNLVSFPYAPGVIENITLYAKWSINTYLVNYNSKGGTSVAAGSFVYGGQVTSAPRKPYRSGAVFIGWSATDGGSVISFPYSPGVASNVTLYAKWTLLAPLLSTSGATTLAPGDALSIKVSRVNEGCTVTVGWLQENIGVDSISKVIKADRSTGVFTIATPSAAGRYTLTTSTIGSECSNGAAVTLARAFTVGQKSSIVAKLSSSSAFVSRNPVVTVSGKVKSGSVAVVGRAMNVSLRRNGVKVASATGTTDSSGAFVASFSGITYLAGEYTTVVTGVADSTYLASEFVANKLTLR